MKYPILKIVNLTKSFGAVKASQNISIELYQNEIHALIGSNGSGKSTIIKLITGFLNQESGKIVLDGNDISSLSSDLRAQKGIARSFQVSSVITKFNLIDNIKLSLIGRNKYSLDFISNLSLKKEIYREAYDFLKEVDLEDKSEQLVSSLSHGEKRKLEICIALSMKPKIFLFDEPMAGLDENSSKLIVKLFKKIKKRAPILLIEHDMETVFSLADRISVLDYGKIIATGTVEEIRNNKTVKEVYLGSDN